MTVEDVMKQVKMLAFKTRLDTELDFIGKLFQNYQSNHFEKVYRLNLTQYLA